MAKNEDSSNKKPEAEQEMGLPSCEVDPKSFCPTFGVHDGTLLCRCLSADEVT